MVIRIATLLAKSPFPNLLMPSTFESLGLKFLYPENWEIAQRAPEDGIDGVTFELPTGGFFSIERTRRSDDMEMEIADRAEDAQEDAQEDALIDKIEKAIAEDYGEVEREIVPSDLFGQDTRQVDFRFYYLDLMIQSRVIFATIDRQRFAIQIQAESRGFDENELVFSAILKQLQAE